MKLSRYPLTLVNFYRKSSSIFGKQGSLVELNTLENQLSEPSEDHPGWSKNTEKSSLNGPFSLR